LLYQENTSPNISRSGNVCDKIADNAEHGPKSSNKRKALTLKW